ncbi:MAG: type II restriction endonuclease [Fimbriimonadales bacterium]|nr:type II restriction endonuclease [Fimbriimonadales bacterium]MDW8051048.1 hypothetical protein [Armatimonadota bacterium]
MSFTFAQASAEGEPEDWDYATADTKTHTHCYHIYPAMMIPQVARRLIRLYGRSEGTLLDPFCGSGTSLVDLYKLISEAFAQSRRTRAGGSAQYHIAYVLDALGYKGQYEMQQKLNSTVDFPFPSRAM